MKPTLPEHVPPGLGCQRRAAGHCEPNGSGTMASNIQKPEKRWLYINCAFLFAKKNDGTSPQFLLYGGKDILTFLWHSFRHSIRHLF